MTALDSIVSGRSSRLGAPAEKGRVVIATPDHWPAGITLAAISADKHGF